MCYAVYQVYTCDINGIMAYNIPHLMVAKLRDVLLTKMRVTIVAILATTPIVMTISTTVPKHSTGASFSGESCHNTVRGHFSTPQLMSCSVC
jgi:hypothetical protein